MNKRPHIIAVFKRTKSVEGIRRRDAETQRQRREEAMRNPRGFVFCLFPVCSAEIRLKSRAFQMAASLLIIFCSFALASAQENKITTEVDKIFAQYDRPDSPGCALSVIKDGNIIYKRGYGVADLDHDIPIVPGSVFHVASVSKQFTAFSILLLAQQGKLSLDDQVRKHIPEVPDFGHPITIRHLLHHTSGLRDQWNLLIMAGWRLSNDVVRDEDVLNLIARQKALNFNPGDQYAYSNTGYTLMAFIVRRVSGLSLREFAEANIFKPLGMTKTFFRDDHAVIVKNQAYAYEPAPGNSFKLSVPNYDTVGASSLLTTVEDLARWDQNFYDFKVGGREIIRQMQETGTLNDGEKISYARGLVLGDYKGLRIVEHGGADAGYRSNIMRFPDERFSVACLCNLSFSSPSALARRVADVYLADKLKQETRKNAAATAIQLTEDKLKPKIGAYWNSWTGEAGKVTLREGNLFLSIPGYNKQITPTGENRFAMSDQPGEVVFEARKLVIKIEGRKPVVFEAQQPADTSRLAQYTGSYYSEEIDSTYKVAVENGKLILTRKKFRPSTLDPLFKDAFATGSILGTIRFTRDRQNRVNGFTVFAGRVRHFAFVKQQSRKV